LGIYISETFSAAAHVDHVLSAANQRLYLLVLLKSRGLSCDTLHVIFTAIVLSIVTYALPSFAGQLSKAISPRLDCLFWKVFWQVFCGQIFSIDEHSVLAADKNKVVVLHVRLTELHAMQHTKTCLVTYLPTNN